MNSVDPKDFELKSYHYELPNHLVAQRPVEPRDHSRLLVFNEKTGEVIHETFKNVAQYLPKKAALVLNNSRVFPCRLLGQKSTGGKAEVFLLSKVPDDNQTYPALIKTTGKKRQGDRFSFSKDLTATIEKLPEGKGHFRLSFEGNLEAYLESKAQVPIPPYIRDGHSDEADIHDYQTVYAGNRPEEEGSVAAPTAGLHFTKSVFDSLKEKEIYPHFVTLHVGLGTFSPVKASDIRDHDMHSENFFVNPDSWDSIEKADFRVAVGTTSLRVLESLWPEKNQYRPGEMKETSIFLHPGVAVTSIDALVTNFHLPESTLLMLVASLIGREKTLELYNLAVAHKYRFFSYGDAMLILRDPEKVQQDRGV